MKHRFFAHTDLKSGSRFVLIKVNYATVFEIVWIITTKTKKHAVSFIITIHQFVNDLKSNSIQLVSFFAMLSRMQSFSGRRKVLMPIRSVIESGR